MRVRRRQPPIDADYQHGLETAFSDWGGEAASRWFFERRLGTLPCADLLLIEEAGRAIAGVALTYRTLALASGAQLVAAMLTGAWTNPDARGRGCFSRLVQEAELLVPERGAALLLASVTSNNGSSRALLRLGHAPQPARYWFAEVPGGVRVAAAQSPSAPCPLPPELEQVLARDRQGGTHVVYPSLADWRSQLLARPRPTALVPVLPDQPGTWAVLERTPDTDRVQALLCETGQRAACIERLRAHAHARGRHLFWFELENDSTPLERPGFSLMPGALTIAAVGPALLRDALGDPAAPDPKPAELLDPQSPWYLGPWRLHSGDRL